MGRVSFCYLQMNEDAFDMNILGATGLVNDDTNKVGMLSDVEEGVSGEYEDVLELPMSDEDLLSLRDEYETSSQGYYPKIQIRQKTNKAYLKGHQQAGSTQGAKPVSKNILFEATATFVPAALAENPEPVVFSDNTDEGKAASNDLKTMLQYHAIQLGFRQKLALMIWQWSEYFIGAVKYGWKPMIDPVTGVDRGDVTVEVRKPQNLILDPNGYVDEFGDFQGWVGDRIEKPASWFIEHFPKHATYIRLKVNDKLGTLITATEWWTDEFSFTTFKDVVLDKHKNEFFNYPDTKSDSATPTINHFAEPKKPYTFFSVFSLQEEPYDFTNLIEQNLSNQDRINEMDLQISKNLRSGNNSVVISGTSFTTETADQAVQSFYEEGFLLSPDGNMDAVKRIPASPLPSGIMEAQQSDIESLRSIYGTSGLIPSNNPDEAVRNNILDTEHDSSRIGGGVGDRIEITASNMFNWLPQLYCVFYTLPRYAAVMGNASAVEYVSLSQENMTRKFVVTVAPNSMKPKDETAEANQALQLAQQGFLDPINLFKALNDPDPVNTAKMVTMFRTNPQLYMQTFFPEQAGMMQTPQGAQPPPQGGQAPPAAGSQEPPTPETLSAPQSSASLSNVPIQPLNQ